MKISSLEMKLYYKLEKSYKIITPRIISYRTLSIEVHVYLKSLHLLVNKNNEIKYY